MFRSVTRASEYPAAAGSGLRFCEPVGVEAVVNKMGEELFVAATVTTAIEGECARCVEPIQVPVLTTFEALYVPVREREEATSRTGRAEVESQRLLYYDNGVADLGDEIVEAVSLAAPMKPLCRPDCRGLCPSCGKNLNAGECGCRRGGEFGKPFRGLFGGTVK